MDTEKDVKVIIGWDAINITKEDKLEDHQTAENAKNSQFHKKREAEYGC